MITIDSLSPVMVYLLERPRKERGIRDRPGEVEGREDVSCEVNDKKTKFGTSGSPNTVISIAEKELGDNASLRLKQGLFNVTERQAWLGLMTSLLTCRK